MTERRTTQGWLSWAALGCAFATCDALAVEYGRLVPDKSQITFEAKQEGVPMGGRFGRFKADVSFDPAKPEAARARIEIDLSSIDLGTADANAEVVRKTWLDVGGFPKATFVGTRFKGLGGGRYEIAGKLTIKGRTQEVVAPVSFAQEGANGRFDGAFKLKRLGFSIGEGAWSDTETVADEVAVRFRLVASPNN